MARWSQVLMLPSMARSLRPTSRAARVPTRRAASSLDEQIARGAPGAVEQRLAELGYELPPVGTPKGSYGLTSRMGNTLYVCGHLPIPPSGELIVGRVGADLDADAAKDAAFWCGMNILATLREVVGFENVVQVHKLVGFVNCVDGFEAQPTVINGCSDLLYEVLGDKGRHARSAVGVNVLPLGVPVEIEAVVEVH